MLVKQHFISALRYHSGSSLSNKWADNIPRSWDSELWQWSPGMPLAFGFAQEISAQNALCYLLVRTVKISVGKCVAHWPGRAIRDAFLRDGSWNNASVCSVWMKRSWHWDSSAGRWSNGRVIGGKRNWCLAQNLPITNRGGRNRKHTFQQSLELVKKKLLCNWVHWRWHHTIDTCYDMPSTPWRACTHGNRSMRKVLCKVVTPTLLFTFSYY